MTRVTTPTNSNGPDRILLGAMVIRAIRNLSKLVLMDGGTNTRTPLRVILMKSGIRECGSCFHHSNFFEICHFREHMIGHFTAMAQDRTNRIGCAGSVYNGAERLLTCNYAFTNLQGSPVYESGPAASGCKTGTNPNYTNLCSTSEDVDPNPQ